jgi:hypothetical protein
LARCDRERLPVYIEIQNEDNVPYCERFGFRIAGQIELPFGVPHLWGMRRETITNSENAGEKGG